MNYASALQSVWNINNVEKSGVTGDKVFVKFIFIFGELCTEKSLQKAISLNELPSVWCFAVQHRLWFIETNLLSPWVCIQTCPPTPACFTSRRMRNCWLKRKVINKHNLHKNMPDPPHHKLKITIIHIVPWIPQLWEISALDDNVAELPSVLFVPSYQYVM